MTEPTSYFRRGAKAIALYLGCSVVSAFHQLERHQIPGAAKQGGAWLLDTRIFEEAHRAACQQTGAAISEPNVKGDARA